MTRPERLYSAYVFDMDGTIYLGDEVLPGVADTLRVLRELGAPVRFLSNNPTKDPEQYAAKLARLGLPTPVSDIANTVVSTVGWLRHHHPDAVVFPIAEEPLIRALRAAGVQLSEHPAEIDIVLASYDRTFDYRKLQIAFDALWFHRRAILVQTNPDRYCPFPGGRGEPDCAAITAAIEACTGVRCSVNLGKPGGIMVAEAVAGLGVEPADVLMVGDRLATDVAMGRDGVRPGADRRQHARRSGRRPARAASRPHHRHLRPTRPGRRLASGPRGGHLSARPVRPESPAAGPHWLRRASSCSRRMSACPQCWASSRKTWRRIQRSVRLPRRFPEKTTSPDSPADAVRDKAMASR